MQKFLNIAEQYVQWFALGLGALYLLFMGWSYVYKSDINVTLGPKTAVEPGDVDATIYKGPVTELEGKMANPEPITIECPDVMLGWANSVSEAVVDVSPTHGVWGSNPYGENGGIRIGPPEKEIVVQIDKLPIIPPAIPVAVAAYRTLAQVPDPAFVAPPDAPDTKAPLVNKDIDATSVQFKIDMQALGKAFTGAFPVNAPPAVFRTMYLKVTLLRQEWDASGNKWGPPTEVPPLKINVPTDYPGDDTTQEKGLGFELWAGANQELILHPPFYQTAPGAPPWTVPTPPADAAAGLPAAGAAPAGLPRQLPVPAVPQGGIRPPSAFDQAPDAGSAWQGQVFNPVTKAADETLVAHDDTVQPEKTYRYYVQYRLLNPLFAAQRLVKDQSLTKPFALVSPGVDKVPGTDLVATPTDKITIPSRTQIFVKQVHNSEAHFAVFVFSPLPVETEVSATPGDPVAPTHWTVVDIRRNESPTEHSDYTVLLVDENGNLQERDQTADVADPAQKDLHDRANAALAPAPAPPAVPVAPVPSRGGVPPVVPPANNPNN